MGQNPVPERPEKTSGAVNAADLDDDDDEPGVMYASSSHPGMMAVRRRSHRRRTVRTKASDVRARQIRVGLLVIIFALIVFDITGHKIKPLAGGLIQIFRPIYHAVMGLHLEVVALVIAAGILIYLTPGVEDSVLRTLGIKRSASSRRR